jgi:hypothetical protein
MLRRLTSGRWRTELGAAAAIGAVALAGGMLWSAKGLAVYFETIAAGLAMCF